jgi:hypothetical protein
MREPVPQNISFRGAAVPVAAGARDLLGADSAHSARGRLANRPGRSGPGRGVRASRNASQLRARAAPAGSPETFRPRYDAATFSTSPGTPQAAGGGQRQPRRHGQRRTRASTKAGVGLGLTSDVLFARRGCERPGGCEARPGLSRSPRVARLSLPFVGCSCRHRSRTQASGPEPAKTAELATVSSGPETPAPTRSDSDGL